VSLKEDIESVKKEISTEESFMENFFKIEKFYKKYKSTIFISISVILVAIIGYYANDYMKMKNTIEANNAFNTLLSDPQNEKALSTLKQKNKKLYDIAQFMQNKSIDNDMEFLKELSLYSQAIDKNDINKLSSIAQEQDFLLKDFALFNKALIQSQNKQYKEAKATLAQIPINSDINVLVKMLEHFLITK